VLRKHLLLCITWLLCTTASTALIGCENEDEDDWEMEDDEEYLAEEAAYEKEMKEEAAKAAKEQQAREEKRAKELLNKINQLSGTWKADLPATMAELTEKAAYQLTITPPEFKRLKDKAEWAFFAKTKDCGGDPAVPMVNAAGRLVENEFEKRRLMATVPKLKSTLIGKLVRFYGDVSFYNASKDDDGAVCASLGGNIQQQIELCRAPYNFKKQQFQFEIRAGANYHWPLSLKSSKPKIMTNKMVFKKKYDVGTWGGKKLRVNRFEEDIEYENGSRFSFIWKVPEAEAEALLKSMQLKLNLVYSVENLGFHKKCKRVCSTVFGVRGCDSENIGWRPDYGTTFSYQVAKIVDFTVKYKGKEVYGVHRMKKEGNETVRTEGVLKEITFAPAELKDNKAVGEAKLLFDTYIGESVITKVPYTSEGYGDIILLKHRQLGKQGLRLTVKGDKTMTSTATTTDNQRVTTYLVR
jgi:hypothetical protein